MPKSKRWKDLERETNRLRRQFLPDPFDPLGVYTDSGRIQAHTRAFLVLSHAEIESYLEGWAKEIARAAETVWMNSQRITRPLAYLLATLAERIEASSKDSPQRLAATSVKLFQRYYKVIKDNNGVKESNVLTLFAPLGVPSSALGATLLPNLDSFGSRGGSHAHESAKAVASVLDPETEYKRVVDVVAELASVDDWLRNYKRTIR